MRDAVRRLVQLRPPTRIVQVRVPSIIAGRRGLPVLLSAVAVVAAASTAATTTSVADRQVVAPAGTTVLPPVAPPTYSYSASAAGAPGATGAAKPPGGTGLNGGQANVAAVSTQLAAGGIPARAVQAYQEAAISAGCGLQWTLLAAIGRVESDHGRFGGATLLSDGRSNPPIVGIPLDGRPDVAVIRDTDGGRYDGDKTYDRAVGPMQFIPSSWTRFGVDGDGDGKSDPFDIDDAASAAAKYLCRAGGDLSTLTGQRNAVYSYNRSTAYVDQVLALAAQYAGGASIGTVPAPGGTPGPIAPPTLPPVGIGPPPAGSPPATTPPGKPKPTGPAPTGNPTSPPPTAHPTSPSPTAHPTSPSPTTSPTSPSGSPTTSPTPTPTCTPVPSATPTPSGSGTITPEGVGSETASGAAASTSPSASGAADATGTPTPSPSPTLPPCPS